MNITLEEGKACILKSRQRFYYLLPELSKSLSDAVASQFLGSLTSSTAQFSWYSECFDALS